MIDQDLVAYLAGLGHRSYLGNAPQNIALPLVVSRRIGGSQPRTLGGATLFERSEFSINVIADNYTDAYPIANEIRDSLKSFKGLMGGTQIEYSRCTVFPIDQSEVEGDRVIRWVSLSFSFMHL